MNILKLKLQSWHLILLEKRHLSIIDRYLCKLKKTNLVKICPIISMSAGIHKSKKCIS